MSEIFSQENAYYNNDRLQSRAQPTQLFVWEFSLFYTFPPESEPQSLCGSGLLSTKALARHDDHLGLLERHPTLVLTATAAVVRYHRRQPLGKSLRRN